MIHNERNSRAETARRPACDPARPTGIPSGDYAPSDTAKATHERARILHPQAPPYSNRIIISQETHVQLTIHHKWYPDWRALCGLKKPKFPIRSFVFRFVCASDAGSAAALRRAVRILLTSSLLSCLPRLLHLPRLMTSRSPRFRLLPCSARCLPVLSTPYQLGARLLALRGCLYHLPILPARSSPYINP